MKKIFFIIILLCGLINVSGLEHNSIIVYDRVYQEFSELSIEEFEIVKNPFISQTYKNEILLSKRICIGVMK